MDGTGHERARGPRAAPGRPAHASGMAALAAKRSIDVLLSATCLFLLGPLLVMVGAAVWMTDGAWPLVRDDTLARDGRRFGHLRFRTTARDEGGEILVIGKFGVMARFV